MKKILIADDSMFMRRILKDILADKYKIVEAESGSQAEEQFKKENPDLVLLDIIMPEGEEEGLKVLKNIMKSDSKAKIIMITALGQDAIKEECIKLGIKDYIVKPFDEKQVTKAVEKYL